MDYKEGSTVYILGKPIALGKELGRGGEGTVFRQNAFPGQVIKIYNKQIPDETVNKIKAFVKLGVNNPQICGPLYPVFSSNGKGRDSLIGFTMYESHGITLDRRLSELFNENNNKNGRERLIKIAVEILKLYDVLYSVPDHRILIGDINLQNIMVDGLKPYLIDVDSIQLNNMNCKVCRPEFLSARMQKAKLHETPRNGKDESFAIATLIFMILFCRRAPFARKNGDSPSENILNCKFQYNVDGTVKPDVPNGNYQYVWAYLPSYLREAFCRVFGSVNQTDWPEHREWLGLMKRYQNEFADIVRQDVAASALWQKAPPVRKTEVKCRHCGKSFTSTAFPPDTYCPACSKMTVVQCPVCGRQKNVHFYEVDNSKPAICQSCIEKSKKEAGTFNSLVRKMSEVEDYSGPELFEKRLNLFRSSCDKLKQEAIPLLAHVDSSVAENLKRQLSNQEFLIEHEREVFMPLIERLETMKLSYKGNPDYDSVLKSVKSGTCTVEGRMMPYSAFPFSKTMLKILEDYSGRINSYLAYKPMFDYISGSNREAVSKGKTIAELKKDAEIVKAHFNLAEDDLLLLNKLMAKAEKQTLRGPKLWGGFSLTLFALCLLFVYQAYVLFGVSTFHLPVAVILLAVSLAIGLINCDKKPMIKVLSLGLDAASAVLVIMMSPFGGSYVLCWIPMNIALVSGFVAFICGYLLTPLGKKGKGE